MKRLFLDQFCHCLYTLYRQPIDVERDLDRFQCAISEFATVAEDPPSITAREIATAAVAVLVRTTAAALIEISGELSFRLELAYLWSYLPIEY